MIPTDDVADGAGETSRSFAGCGATAPLVYAGLADVVRYSYLYWGLSWAPIHVAGVATFVTIYALADHLRWADLLGHGWSFALVLGLILLPLPAAVSALPGLQRWYQKVHERHFEAARAACPELSPPFPDRQHPNAGLPLIVTFLLAAGWALAGDRVAMADRPAAIAAFSGIVALLAWRVKPRQTYYLLLGALLVAIAAILRGRVPEGRTLAVVCLVLIVLFLGFLVGALLDHRLYLRAARALEDSLTPTSVP